MGRERRERSHRLRRRPRDGPRRREHHAGDGRLGLRHADPDPRLPRTPRRHRGPDNGGDSRLDVYLADVGGAGVFGYCVLDNDFSTAQFGTTHTPLQNLQVTAAHEIFHAVKFAYDWTEDLWLMEGTAAWIEDELFDDVDDIRRYLAVSPLAASGLPLDFAPAQWPGYGAWAFWRFLSEWLAPRGAAEDPNVVRQVWERAAGPTYSTSALGQTLTARHTSLAVALGVFEVWNRNPGQFYSEGLGYHAVPLLARRTFTLRSRSMGAHVTRVAHLSQRFVRFTPGTSLSGRWRLQVAVDMPALSRGSHAWLVAHRRDGDIAIYPIGQSRSGNGWRSIAFDRRTTAFVELALVKRQRPVPVRAGHLLHLRGSPPRRRVAQSVRRTRHALSSVRTAVSAAPPAAADRRRTGRRRSRPRGRRRRPADPSCSPTGRRRSCR
jgi:hypothetical protein